MDIRKNLETHTSATASKWREAAVDRRNNKPWLRFSQQVAMAMLDRMEQKGLTQKQLAELMGCSQQYVSKVLKGRENLSIETICKIEDALQLHILPKMAEMTAI